MTCHRFDEGDIVHASGDIRQQVGHPLAGLAVLAELPTRFHDPPLVAAPLAAVRFDFDGLVIAADQCRFVIEHVDMARPTVHVEKDDALGLGGKMGRLRRQRAGPRRDSIGGHGLLGKEPLLIQESGQRQPGKPGSRLPKKLPPGASAKRAVLLL